MEQNKVLSVVIYKTTNGNYRFEVGEVLSMSNGSIKVHPLLAGVPDLACGFQKLSELYPDYWVIMGDLKTSCDIVATALQQYGRFAAILMPKPTAATIRELETALTKG